MSAISAGEVVEDAPALHAQALYERHHEHLYRHCLRLLGSADEADDAVQQTFLNAIRSLRHGVVPEYETAWLCAIARNVCRDRRRAVARRRRVETPHDLDLLQDRLPDNADGVDTDIGALCDALRRLDPDQQRAILFREWHGLSHQEIAARLHRSPKAVEALLYRARRSLERTLRPGERLRRGLNLGGLLSLAKTLAPGSPIKTAAVLVATATTIAAAPGSAPADTDRIAALLPRETRGTTAVAGTAVHGRPPAQHALHRALPTAGPANGQPTARAVKPPATTPAAPQPPTVPARAPQPAVAHEAGAARPERLPAHEAAPSAPRAEEATAVSEADAESPAPPPSAAKRDTRLETKLLPQTLLPETGTLPTPPAPNLALRELPPPPDPTITALAGLPAGSDDLPSVDPLSADVEETASTAGQALPAPDGTEPTSTLVESTTATSAQASPDTTAAVAAAASRVDGGAVAG